MDYFSGPFRYRVGANGHIQIGKQYGGIATDGTLYAIRLYEDGSVAYQENGGNCNPAGAHLSIASHFDVPLARLLGSRVK